MGDSDLAAGRNNPPDSVSYFDDFVHFLKTEKRGREGAEDPSNDTIDVPAMVLRNMRYSKLEISRRCHFCVILDDRIN